MLNGVKRMRRLLKNVFVLPMGEQTDVFQGYLGISQDRIDYVGSDEPGDIHSYEEVIDGKGRLVMPGLINTHGHAAMSLLRGYGDDLPLQVWLQERIWPMEAKFTAEHVKWGTALSILEMLKTGTTTFADMYMFEDEVAEMVEQSGMRASLSRGVIGLGSEQEARDKLADSRRFASAWHGKANGRITAMIAPHAPYTCPPWYIEEILAVAHELDLPMHIHMSETAREVEENESQYGVRPVAHLERLGVFKRHTLVAHSVHVNEEEMDILNQYRVQVAHNPISNLKLASGIAPVPRMLEKGIDVSLATDGPASNNNLDMFEEMRMAALIHKGVTYNPIAIPARTALEMATVNGAKALQLNDVGMLKVGYKADFILLDISGTPYQPPHDLVSHLVYSGSGRDVRDVYVDGQCVVKEGSCMTLDEEKVIYEANRCVNLLLS
jgi:5-methylthioadenosine/S-adenosylhomocysteine deaminase